MIGVAFVLAFTMILALRLRSNCVSRYSDEMGMTEFRKPFLPCLSLEESLDPHHGELAAIQVRTLALIREAGHKGVYFNCLRPAYEELASHFPELYDGSTFEQWLRFYHSAHVVVITGANVRLGPQGLRLLQHSSSVPLAD
jgi:hypothetical protein